MNDEVLIRTRTIVERIAGPERTPAEVVRETRLTDGFWLDSVELLEVVMACETEFGIVFSESGDLDATQMGTLGSLADLIAIRLKEQAGQS